MLMMASSSAMRQRGRERLIIRGMHIRRAIGCWCHSHGLMLGAEAQQTDSVNDVALHCAPVQGLSWRFLLRPPEGQQGSAEHHALCGLRLIYGGFLPGP